MARWMTSIHHHIPRFEWTLPANVVPGLLDFLDYPDVASLAMPLPLLVVAGRQDPLFPPRCRELLAMPEPISQQDRDYRVRYQELSGHDLLLCPQCGTGTMVRIGFIPAGHTLPSLDSS